ncbi:hypothetical protein DFH29DRAFT_925269 [Suillus ampliporus]|nr:hypothetical protein DFH29DRAFT_925269 [Suillus ampliporus]
MVNHWHPSEVDVQNYYQRLVDHSLIPQSRASQEYSSPSAPDSDGPRCLICSHHLVACNGCSIVTCSDANGQCAGADLVTLVPCHTHDNEKFCPSCLTNEYSGALIHCVYCRSWHCQEFMRKCLGRPAPEHQLTRAHSPKFIVCSYCFPWIATMRECSELDCWSDAHNKPYVGAICYDCAGSKDSHIVCPCGHTWVCGSCAQKKIQESGIRCPGCQTFYCVMCRYINVCMKCQKATLCNDCMEEEMSDEEESSKANKGVVIVMTCDECERTVCTDCCFDEREFRCQSCNSVRCRECLGKCYGCGAFLCTTCLEAGYQECKG